MTTRSHLISILLATAALLVTTMWVQAAGSPASPQAGTCLTCLGKPTSDIDQNLALGAFRHIGGSLHQGSLPALFFVGLEGGGREPEDSWAIVKALEQFGTFGHLAAERPICGSTGGVAWCSPPGFNLSRPAYRSRYVAFASRYILNIDNKPFQAPTRAELQFFSRYIYRVRSLNTLTAVNRLPSGTLPSIAVGGYLSPALREITNGDFDGPYVGPTPTVCPASGCGIVRIFLGPTRPFADIQQSLATGHPVDGLPASLIPDVNTAANIITALICHADGKKPASVCGRPVIKAILRAVK